MNGYIAGVTGGDPMSAFAAGGLSSLAGSAFSMYAPDFAKNPVGQLAFGAVSGGAGAAATGGDFWQGAAIGLMTTGLNHMQDHTSREQRKKAATRRNEYYRYAIENAKSWEDKVDLYLNWAGGYDVDYWLRQTVREEVGAVAAGAVMLYPGVGLTNDVNILFTGQDIYGNQATTLDYIISGFGLASAGVASGVIRVSRPVMRWAEWGNKATNIYTIPNTIYQNANKP